MLLQVAVQALGSAIVLGAVYNFYCLRVAVNLACTKSV